MRCPRKSFSLILLPRMGMRSTITICSSTYHTPCFIFKLGTLYANLTEVQKRQYFQELLTSYRQQGYANAEIPHFEIKSLGQDSALITVEWVCKRSDNSIAFDFWDSYYLIHIDGKREILGDTVHE
jgi:hypothetical protein